MALPANSTVGNVNPAPAGSFVSAIGSYAANFTTDVEIMYSMQGYTQKGCTLKAGQGVLPAGTILGRITASKLWVLYSNAASDGSEVARGFLRTQVDTGTDVNGNRYLGNVVILGILKNSALSGVDSAAIADLNARVDTVMDTFTF